MKRFVLVWFLSVPLIGIENAPVYAQEKPDKIVNRTDEVFPLDTLLAMRVGIPPYITVDAAKLDSSQLAVIGKVFQVPPHTIIRFRWSPSMAPLNHPYAGTILYIIWHGVDAVEKTLRISPAGVTIAPSPIPVLPTEGMDAKSPSIATPRIEKAHYWVTMGFGVDAAKIDSDEYPGLLLAGIGFSVHSYPMLVSARLLYYGGDPYVTDNWVDLGVIYGIFREGRWGMGAISAGGGLTLGSVNRTSFVFGTTGESFLKPAIPLEIQMFFHPTSFLGLGALGLANLNTRNSFTGLFVCLRVGRLR